MKLDEEIDTSLFNSIQPPCEYYNCKDDPNPAEWIVYYDLSVMCNCDCNQEVRLFCSPCWEYRNSGDGVTHCFNCWKDYGYMENVIRVEKI